jgi:hypothetical protein
MSIEGVGTRERNGIEISALFRDDLIGTQSHQYENYRFEIASLFLNFKVCHAYNPDIKKAKRSLRCAKRMHYFWCAQYLQSCSGNESCNRDVELTAMWNDPKVVHCKLQLRRSLLRYPTDMYITWCAPQTVAINYWQYWGLCSPWRSAVIITG